MKDGTWLTCCPERRKSEQNVSALEDFERWKMTTDPYRFIASDADDDKQKRLLDALHEIERLVLVEEVDVLSNEHRRVAQEEGWAAVLIALFLALDLTNPPDAYDPAFYRKMWLSTVMAPVRTLVRLAAVQIQWHPD